MLEDQSAITISAERDVIVSGELIGRDKNVYHNYGPSEKEELHDFLVLAAQSYSNYIRSLLPNAPPITTPYLFLLPFETQHHAIFFGRDQVTDDLHKVVLNNRLTVLHARSGAGKTSLLNAGLGLRLIKDPEVLPIFARTYTDPISAVINELADRASRPTRPRLLSKVPLREALAMLAQRPHRPTGEKIVIILDQFEEIFTKTPRLVQAAFIDAIATCVEDNGLPVHFVLAIRGEYLSDLGSSQRRLPTILDVHYPLLAMTPSEIEKAITGPVQQVDSAIIYDERLLETLVSTLRKAEMDLPTLQIICDRLYRASKVIGNTVITLDLYQELGGAEGILAGYIDYALEPLSPARTELAKHVLMALVDSKGERQIASPERIRQTIGKAVKVTAISLNKVLGSLVQARLLRVSHKEQGKKWYELAHDYLAAEVGHWIDKEDLPRRQVRELVERGLANYSLGALLDTTVLHLVEKYQREFDWTEQEIIFMGHSALICGFEPDFWARKLARIGQRDVLAEGLKSENGDARLAAAVALGQLSDTRALYPLIDALQNGKRTVRRKAAAVLGELGDARAVKALAVALLQDEWWRVRRSAAKALGQLEDARAVAPLIAALRDQARSVRWCAEASLDRFGNSAVEPLITALQDGDTHMRRIAASMLISVKDARTVEPLIVALEDTDYQVAQSAARALTRQEDIRTVEPLIAVLQYRHTYDFIRREAAEALGQLGDARAVEPLIAVLQDKEVCFTAARALGHLGDTHALEPLIAALQEDESSYRRSGAAEALGRLGDDRAIAPLIAALQDEAWEVRLGAAEALGRLGDDRGIALLIAALQDRDRRVRRNAAKALGQLGDVRAIGPLEAILDAEGVNSVIDEVEAALKELNVQPDNQ